MSENINRWATLPAGSNIVENIILAPDGFTLEGYTLTIISSGVFCGPGMFYNSADGLYYQDSSFTEIYPEATFEPGSTDIVAEDSDAQA